MDAIYQIPLMTISGEEVNLENYAPSVMLIVNTASRCGFTGQYGELESLYQLFQKLGFVVIGFPCNQFANQEPGTVKEIQQFCSTSFHITFPMFAKVKVNGNSAHPLFQELKHRAPGILGTEAIKWNFTKFLVAPYAKSVTRFSSATTPASMESSIRELLPS